MQIDHQRPYWKHQKFYKILLTFFGLKQTTGEDEEKLSNHGNSTLHSQSILTGIHHLMLKCYIYEIKDKWGNNDKADWWSINVDQVENFRQNLDVNWNVKQ